MYCVCICTYQRLSGGGGNPGIYAGMVRDLSTLFDNLSPGWGEWIVFARRSKQDPRGKTRGIC